MHGKTAEFVDLQRQMAEARKKAGLPGRWVWQEVRGDSSTYHIVSFEKNLAAFDELGDNAMSDAESARWIDRITAITHTRKVANVQLYSDLVIDPNPGYQPNLLRLTERRIKQGYGQAYRKWLTEKQIPMRKKLGGTGYSVGKTILGGNTNTWTTAQHFSSWAEMDKPGIFSKLSAEEREELFASSRELVIDTHTILARYRSDMSNDDPK